MLISYEENLSKAKLSPIYVMIIYFHSSTAKPEPTLNKYLDNF
jgi:hypothetical protein